MGINILSIAVLLVQVLGCSGEELGKKQIVTAEKMCFNILYWAVNLWILPRATFTPQFQP